MSTDADARAADGFNTLDSTPTNSPRAYSSSQDHRWQGSGLQTTESRADATDSGPISIAGWSDILETSGQRLTGATAFSGAYLLASDVSAIAGPRHSVDGGVRVEGGPPGQVVEEPNRRSAASTLPPPYQHYTP